MATIYTPHFSQFFDDNGTPLAGGKLYTYEAGTTTPKATYTTAEGDVACTNPIILDAAGRATFFIDGSYKFTLHDANDVLVKTTDNITAYTTLTLSGTSLATYMATPPAIGGTTPAAGTFTTVTTTATTGVAPFVVTSQTPVPNLTVENITGAGTTFTQNAILKGNAGSPVTPSTVAFDAGASFLVGATSAYSDGSYGQPVLQAFSTTGLSTGFSIKVVSGSASTPMAIFVNSNGAVGAITTNGSATAYATSSDARLKTNIAPLTGSGEVIDALRPVTFDWLVDGEHAEGFIAQELYEVIPAAVSVGDDNLNLKQGDAGFKPWAVDFSKIVPILVAEVKELRRRLAALETQ